MHVILKKNVDELTSDYELESDNEDKKFEYFCNFCVVSKKFLGRFNPKDVTTGDDDASLDGIALIIDGELVLSLDDAQQIFDTHKKNLQVDLIFNQVKNTSSFTKRDIANYKIGLDDFLSLEPEFPNGDLNQKSLSLFKLVLDNLRKVKNRRPNAFIFYCSSAPYNSEREIKASFSNIKKSIEDTDLFHEVEVLPLGRSELLKYWADISEKNEAKIKLIDYFAMPGMPGIPQSYMAVVNAKEFVEKLIRDESGLVKNGVFEENIRAFLGMDNEVNSNIKGTLESESKKELFSVLNNGVTIVSPEMTLSPSSKEIDLTNYQIINGCQTSNTLFNCIDQLGDSVNVVVKFIESPDSEISTDIIAATNSQTSVLRESFYGLNDKAKLVQKYFEIQNTESTQENKIYFERRQNEYREHGHQSTRIFDVKESARCFAAMFLNQPHNSARYVKTLFYNENVSLFASDHVESLYYCAALAAYKYNTLINGKKINAHNYNKLRWHVIYLFKWVVLNEVVDIHPNSQKSERNITKIVNCLCSPDRKYVEKFKECHKIIDRVSIPSEDALKRGKYTALLREEARAFFNQE